MKDMESKILVVTGMHRSGTSLVSQYLQECGINMGRRLINLKAESVASAYNGHHEDSDFVEFHERVLRNRRVSIFVSNESRFPIKLREVERNEVLRLLEARKNFNQWGWKDPRTSLFLEFWQEMIPNAKYIFLFRDPLEVVDSLIRRNTDKAVSKSPVTALRAWKLYNKKIARFWKVNKGLVLVRSINEVISDPITLYAPLAEQMNFVLASVEFGSIYSSGALINELTDQVIELKHRHPREVKEAFSTYEELMEISYSSFR